MVWSQEVQIVRVVWQVAQGEVHLKLAARFAVIWSISNPPDDLVCSVKEDVMILEEGLVSELI